MEEVYHCDTKQLDNFLISKDVDITDESLWNKLLSKKYCKHIIRKKDQTTKCCHMYRIEDSEYCKLHTKKICYLCNKPINFKDKY